MVELNHDITFEQSQALIRTIRHTTARGQVDSKWRRISGSERGIRAQSFCWFVCWAYTGMTSSDAKEDAQRIFDQIFSETFVNFSHFLEKFPLNGSFHTNARDIRNNSSAQDESSEKKLAELLNNIQPNNNIKGDKHMDNYVDLLLANSNIILTGAPGTGKTYLAKQIAMQMIFSDDSAKASLDPNKLEGEDKKIFDEHFRFVQFHPSYDYTDFVEGLRPTEPNDQGNVGFMLRNGTFKAFCKRAKESKRQENPSDNFDEAWQEFLQKLEKQSLDEHPSLKISENILVQLTRGGSIGDTNPNFGTYTRQNIYNVYRGLKGRDSGAFDSRMKKIRDYLKENCNLRDYVKDDQDHSGTNETTKNNPPYIFVIDEINRGEISKIFGELFFSIDPGYPGKKGKVQTQYANMQSGDTIFDENEGPGWFYVPENVYIIGTMNDIDRSVESMDFAMRRRFVWKEITAKESAENMKLPEGVKSRMNALNNAIWPVKEDGSTDIDMRKKDVGVAGLSSAYHIGGAYFRKLLGEEGYGVNETGYQKLWDMHLKPLLSEYLRGVPQSDSILEKLKSAYNPAEPYESKDETATEDV